MDAKHWSKSTYVLTYVFLCAYGHMELSHRIHMLVRSTNYILVVKDKRDTVSYTAFWL